MSTYYTEVSPLFSTLPPLKPAKSKLCGFFELTRLHKSTIGNLCFFWPCAWALTMAAYSTDMPLRDLLVYFTMYLIGSTLIHSANCIINDIFDIDFDRQVSRTKSRPLPSGVVSVSEAWIFFFFNLSPAVAMLLLINLKAALIGLLEVFPLLVFYPLMKRWTYWPQAFLGLTINWGFPTAWMMIMGTTRLQMVSIFMLGMICWTIVYDTMYALQDREDDIQVGIKSTAVLFGDWRTNKFLTWNVNSPDEGRIKYESHGITGALIWIGLLVDYWLKTSTA
ncbi:UbiA prenyltransferase family protein [Abortiporus biennis]